MIKAIRRAIGAYKHYREHHTSYVVRYLNRRICSIIGHDIEEFADFENGRGTLDCKRCGESQPYQW